MVFQNDFSEIKTKNNLLRDYKNYSNYKFREELLYKLSLQSITNTSNDLEKFCQICISVMNKICSQKKNYIRWNNMPSINKNLTEAHKKRSHLRN